MKSDLGCSINLLDNKVLVQVMSPLFVVKKMSQSAAVQQRSFGKPLDRVGIQGRVVAQQAVLLRYSFHRFPLGA